MREKKTPPQLRVLNRARKKKYGSVTEAHKRTPPWIERVLLKTLGVVDGAKHLGPFPSF